MGKEKPAVCRDCFYIIISSSGLPACGINFEACVIANPEGKCKWFKQKEDEE